MSASEAEGRPARGSIPAEREPVPETVVDAKPAAAVAAAEDDPSAVAPAAAPSGLFTPEERRTLLALARARLGAHLEGASVPELPDDLGPKLRAPCGVFVSIHNEAGGGDRLRGCTGFIEPRLPLVDAVLELVVASASRDRRFSPVVSEELPDLRLEISVLTPLATLTDLPGGVEVGRHGLYVRYGPRGGLLLPQVATQYGWAPDEFLDHTCEKAGLPRRTWREPETAGDLEVFTFEAQVFQEQP